MEKINITKGKAIIALAVVVVAFALRFVCKMLFDGTVYYSNLVASYTHYAAAFGILFIFAWLFERKPWRWVRFINDVSFEIYLWHYLFLWPPLSTMKLTPWWAVNVALAMVATFVIAWVMNRLAGVIEKLFKGKKV